jgi:Integrase zinc binding domain
VGSRVGSRQREQSAWQDGQPVCRPYISLPDYDTVELPSKKEILLVQQSAVDEYERCQQGNAMARQEVPPQQVDAVGMRLMNNALWIPERAVELQLRLFEEARCRSAGHKAYEARLGAIKEYVAWTTMAKDVKVFVQNCLHCIRYNSWRQSAAPAVYAATRNQAQQDPAFRLLVHRVVKRRVFCRPDQCSLTNSYVDDNSCLIIE